jgi:hypothetical protein
MRKQRRNHLAALKNIDLEIFSVSPCAAPQKDRIREGGTTPLILRKRLRKAGCLRGESCREEENHA